MQSPDLFDDIQTSAEISDCGTYRWRLDRWWGGGPRVVWLMLNPSKADSRINDPTVKRCMHFAKSWELDGVTIVNVFPYRSSRPCYLFDWLQQDDLSIAHKENLLRIQQVGQEAGRHMVAFGNSVPSYYRLWLRRVVLPTFTRDNQLYCLGRTEAGWPIHPMARGKKRVHDDRQPLPWAWPA